MPTILQKRVRLAAKRCAGASDLVFWFVLVALWVLVAWVGSWLWLGALFCLVLFLGWFPLFCGCSFGVFFFPGLESDDDIHHEHARKLKVFKHILSQVGEDPSEGLAMIDAVQRLGIDYHFQDEIEEILPRQYMIAANNSTRTSANDDLQQVALRFRLLRQEGYNVPAGVFNNFILNNKGKFIKWNVSEDIKGLMGLFEASQLSIGTGEDHLLDEAEDITTKFLNEYYCKMMDLDDDDNYYQARVIVGNTLKYPHHKSLPRFVAKNLFLSNYQGENGWIHVLQELAKIDYNVVQSLHQREIVQVSKWWKDLGLAKKLGFARDKPV
ncbi:hypothetical protein Q3G72_011461 [Acer saccharum]|nr:hypothetical protein Q3G72_011461 [Acer saccharum]